MPSSACHQQNRNPRGRKGCRLQPQPQQRTWEGGLAVRDNSQPSLLPHIVLQFLSISVGFTRDRKCWWLGRGIKRVGTTLKPIAHLQLLLVVLEGVCPPYQAAILDIRYEVPFCSDVAIHLHHLHPRKHLPLSCPLLTVSSSAAHGQETAQHSVRPQSYMPPSWGHEPQRRVSETPHWASTHHP